MEATLYQIRSFIRISLCLLALVGSARAADDTAPPDLVTWAEVRALIDDDPASRLAQSRIDLAASELAEARRYPNPEVSARYGRGEPDDEREDDGAVWGVDAEIPIEWIGTRIHHSRAARRGTDAAALEARADRLVALHELRALYVGVAHDQALLEALREGLRHHEVARDAVRLRVEKGDARPVEIERMESSLAEARAELRIAEAEAIARRAALASRLGRDPAREFRVAFDLRERPPVPPLDATLARAREENPAAGALTARAEQSEALAKAEGHAAFPDLAIGGFYDRDLDARSFGGLVTLEVPLWNWNRAGVRRARAERESAASSARLEQRGALERVAAIHARLVA
ncbi:MAG: TolC family protein, partial [Deltaproteobacteria bacterium]|nr:TolC family protein [Deltaproteobacteria bacterium]